MSPRREFGRGTRVYNVIDARQCYLQDVVVAGLRALGYDEQAEQSIHFSYEMVALSPRCCADLGIALSEEDRERPYVEVSGRKGLGVKADDLMDTLIRKALDEVACAARRIDGRGAEARWPRRSPLARCAISCSSSRATTVIAFDLQEALSFEGETGPYVQYAAVRARNILRKLEERGEAMPDFAAELTARGDGAANSQSKTPGRCCWRLRKPIRRWKTRSPRASRRTWPSTLSHWRKRSTTSITNTRSCTSRTARRRVFLLWMTDFFRRQLERTAAILGIRIPEYM